MSEQSFFEKWKTDVFGDAINGLEDVFNRKKLLQHQLKLTNTAGAEREVLERKIAQEQSLHQVAVSFLPTLDPGNMEKAIAARKSVEKSVKELEKFRDKRTKCADLLDEDPEERDIGDIDKDLKAIEAEVKAEITELDALAKEGIDLDEQIKEKQAERAALALEYGDTTEIDREITQLQENRQVKYATFLALAGEHKPVEVDLDSDYSSDLDRQEKLPAEHPLFDRFRNAGRALPQNVRFLVWTSGSKWLIVDNDKDKEPLYAIERDGDKLKVYKIKQVSIFHKLDKKRATEEGGKKDKAFYELIGELRCKKVQQEKWRKHAEQADVVINYLNDKQNKLSIVITRAESDGNDGQGDDCPQEPSKPDDCESK